MKIGDLVTWTSQSCGISKTKTGTIGHIVPPCVNPDLRGIAKKLNVRVHDLSSSSRPIETYLVIVPSENPCAKARLYWPRTSWLKLVPAVAGVNTGAAVNATAPSV